VAHKTRGSISHTYDIKEVLGVDLDQLAIRYTDAAHAKPLVMRLKSNVTPAARQLVKAMADSIAVHGDGAWESSETLKVAAVWAQVLLRHMEAADLDDFGSPDVDLKALRKVLEPFDPGIKRTANKLIGRILVEVHPNGAVLARALRNTTYMVKDTSVRLYDDTEADAIQRAALAVFQEAFVAQRRVIGELGVDTATRAWLKVPASKLVDEAAARHGALVGSPQPPTKSPRIELIDWALLNPEAFGVEKGRPLLIGKTMESIGRALHPPVDVLVAALILHCFAELSGMNLAVMLRTEPQDLVRTGEKTGILSTSKARNHSEDAVAVRTESNQTLGGLIEALTGLTRFSRHFRTKELGHVEDVPEVVHRLYVMHKRDARQSEVLTNQQLHKGWRSESFDVHWPEKELDREAVGLRFTALRRKALERAVAANPKGDVHGHSARVRVHYLANVLPEHTLVRHATAAQDEIIEAALAKFTAITESTNERAKQLAATLEQGRPTDVVVGVCASGGNDPDEPARPCSLGLAACFTCPSGYRTADHIPGLIALVRYAQIIKDNDPDEWENGDASLLSFFATECLKQFPIATVRAVEAHADLRSQMAVINGLYTELRR
jgi:hypothetical protein